MPFKKTYWNNAGKHKTLLDALNKLIPEFGEIEGKNVVELERFRRTQNLYYDLYNNGFANTEKEEAFEIFGFDPEQYRSILTGSYENKKYKEDLFSRAEKIVDRAILRAAKEQGLTKGDL